MIIDADAVLIISNCRVRSYNIQRRSIKMQMKYCLKQLMPYLTTFFLQFKNSETTHQNLGILLKVIAGTFSSAEERENGICNLNMEM